MKMLKINKCLCLASAAILLLAVAMTSKAVAAPTPACINFTLYNAGGYILDYNFIDLQNSNPCNPAWSSPSGSIDLGVRKEFLIPSGTRIKLHAAWGDTTYLTLNQAGEVKCTGTTLIHFHCGYTQ